MTAYNTLGYANVGRFGLAHSLLAWARCKLWCDDHQVQMIAPSWRHLRVGPYLRREMDKRAYHRLFHFPSYITGLRRIFLLAGLPRINVEETDLAAWTRSDRRCVVVFNNRIRFNEETHFHEIVGRQVAVRQSLIEITRPQYRPPQLTAPHVAIHVRMGDFKNPPGLGDLKRGLKNTRLPVQWYAAMLAGLRQCLGILIPARLYSDGSDEMLRDILEQPNVNRIRGQAAITDLLCIAQANVVLSSGSGFSQWGSYLGHVPRICFPGQRMFRVHRAEQGSVDLEPECESAEALPSDFIRYLKGLVAKSEPEAVTT